MTFKHYDVVRAASAVRPCGKADTQTERGLAAFGSPVAITPYTLMQAITAEGDVSTHVVV